MDIMKLRMFMVFFNMLIIDEFIRLDRDEDGFLSMQEFLKQNDLIRPISHFCMRRLFEGLLFNDFN
jgi:hypothetical protein